MGSQVIGGEVITGQGGDLPRSGGSAKLRLKLRMGCPGRGDNEGGQGASETSAASQASGAQQQQQQQEQQQQEVIVVDARYVINSAGLHAQDVAACIRGLPAAAIPPRHLAKGNYFSLASSSSSLSPQPTSSMSSSLSDTPTSTPSPSASTSTGAPFSRLIYPVPEPGGLGIHYTLDMAGQAKFGPDVEWVQGIDYAVSAEMI